MLRCLYFSIKHRGKHSVKKNILRALYERFDPYVFTFKLETETVFTLFFSTKRESDLYLSALRGRDDVSVSVALPGHDVKAK